MNNATSPSTPVPPADSAESIFQRIQRRRGPAAATVDHQVTAHPETSSSKEPAQQRTEEHTTPVSSYQPRSAHRSATRNNQPSHRIPLIVDETGTPLDDDPVSDDLFSSNITFPRSKTVQTMLRYPTVTAAIGLTLSITAATRILKRPAARQTIFRLGKFAAEQQLWKYVRKLTYR